MDEIRIPPNIEPYVSRENYEAWVKDSQQAKANPSVAIAQFAAVYEAFVADIEKAVENGARRSAAGELDTTVLKNLESWQMHTVPLLKKHLVAIHIAVAQAQKGDTAAILDCADSEAHLAKNLDGYWMPFASQSVWQEIWDKHLDRIVRTACLVCAAFGK